MWRLGLVILVIGAVPARGAISYATAGTVVTENFDSLITSGTNQTWANDSTLLGWSLFNKDLAAIALYDAGTGTSNAGKFYSFGAAGVAERALGGVASGGTYFGTPGPASGAVAGWIALSLVNNTGSALTQVSVAYAGEQWRDGGNATPTPQTMRAEWGTGADFSSVTWTPAGASFDFTSPVNATTASAVDGNAAGRVPGLGGSISVLWNPGETLWIRWIETNDAGNDAGLAIDDFSVSAVPEPGVALLSLVAVVGGFISRRRR